jgi:hypothetical protein
MSWYGTPLWDLRPDITSCQNVAVWKLRPCFCGAPSLTRGRVCNLQCNHSMVRVGLAQPGGPGSRIYIPQEQGGPVIPLALGSSYDSQGYCGGILTRLHTTRKRRQVLVSDLRGLSVHLLFSPISSSRYRYGSPPLHARRVNNDCLFDGLVCAYILHVMFPCVYFTVITFSCLVTVRSEK